MSHVQQRPEISAIFFFGLRETVLFVRMVNFVTKEGKLAVSDGYDEAGGWDEGV